MTSSAFALNFRSRDIIGITWSYSQLLERLVEAGDLAGDPDGLVLVGEHEFDDLFPGGQKAAHLVRLLQNHVVGRNQDVGVKFLDVVSEFEQQPPLVRLLEHQPLGRGHDEAVDLAALERRKLRGDRAERNGADAVRAPSEPAGQFARQPDM